jgi:hypothetical protein
MKERVASVPKKKKKRLVKQEIDVTRNLERLSYEKSMLHSLTIIANTERQINEKIRDALKERNVTPVLVAFTLMHDRYTVVEDTKKFEQSTQYTMNDAERKAISENQFCIDMQSFPFEYKSIASIFIYLRQGQSPMHIVIMRQPIRNESFFIKFFIPSIVGYYYKILVDFSQTKPKCRIT